MCNEVVFTNMLTYTHANYLGSKLGRTLEVRLFTCIAKHNITQLMSCVHRPGSGFKNKASRCWNPTTLDYF